MTHSDCWCDEEFVNKKVLIVLMKRGIRQLITPSYNPQENDIMEREKRTIEQY